VRSAGVDCYEGENVSALVVELPTKLIAAKAGAIRVWATASRLVGRSYVQQDRVGLPAVNVALVPAGSRDDYNLAAPGDDLKRFGPALDETLQALGITDQARREGLAKALLPDTLSYDPAKPSG